MAGIMPTTTKPASSSYQRKPRYPNRMHVFTDAIVESAKALAEEEEETDGDQR